MGEGASKDGSTQQHCRDDRIAVHCNRFRYRHWDRRMPYRRERMEMSDEEKQRVRELVDLARSERREGRQRNEDGADCAVPRASPRKVIIDTDIGTDIDDALALLSALNMPSADLELVGIVTNYYPTKLRARVAQEMMRAGGREDIPIVAGCTTLCGSHRDIFLHGNEGKGVNIDETELSELCRRPSPEEDGAEAVEFIVNTLRKHPGEVTIVAIGMCTNLGMCAHRYGKEFAALVRHVYVMGSGTIVARSNLSKACEEDVEEEVASLGRLPPSVDDAVDSLLQLERASTSTGSQEEAAEDDVCDLVHLFPNHNVSGDTLATKLLFDLPQCSISVIPHGITSRFWLKGTAIETLLSSGAGEEVQDASPSTRVCGKLLYEWLSSRWGQRGQCPHDPLTLYEAVYEDDGRGLRDDAPCSVLQYVRGTFVFHEWAAFATFIPHPRGQHRMAVSLRGEGERPQDAWLEWLTDSLLAGVPREQRVETSPVKTQGT